MTLFLDLVQRLSAPREVDKQGTEEARRRCLRHDRPALAAAALVLSDLVGQGWGLAVDPQGNVTTRPPKVAPDAAGEKRRVRRQELLKRDEQLATPSVQRFIGDMERPREFNGRFVSIFSLMRDGQELRRALEALPSCIEPTALRAVVDPYVQMVDSTDRCPHTGLRLMDIWRYFRHTWTNQYTSTPGRTMLLLVRDRAAPFHPVMGIAALGSPIVQIKQRDDWIGWQSSTFVSTLAEQPTLRMARWLVRRMDEAMADLYVDDLLEDGLYWPSLWKAPQPDAIARLRKEAEARRNDHRRFVKRREFKKEVDQSDEATWRQRAETDLFRSKRCLALAELLHCREVLGPFLLPVPSRAGLAAALDDKQGQRAVADIVRRAKAESVGTEMADLIVCGSIAPYNALLGGKLVSMLSVSPSVARAYRQRYGNSASVIASSMAGRSIHRRTNLAYVGTTSLYGSGSSQYNRLRIPAEVLGGDEPIEYRELGRSVSFGTSHFSAETVAALVRLSEQSRTGVRVNSIFGEGVNPKLRKVRDGLDLLGWPSDQLLRHGRQRIVYGVNLVTNLLPYLIGVDSEPSYRFRRNVKDDVVRISDWWFERWLLGRLDRPEVLAAVSTHRLDRPVRHGARVPVVKTTSEA